MAYEQSKLGFGGASGSGNVVTAIKTHFGPRDSGNTSGVLQGKGSAVREIVFELNGTMVGNEAFDVLAPYLPAYSRIEDVFVEITEAFVLGGTTPVINIGTEGSEATNKAVISETIGEAVGVYDITSTLAGTWAQSTGLTAKTVIGIDLAGTTPTVTSAGKAKVIIRYVKV